MKPHIRPVYGLLLATLLLFSACAPTRIPTILAGATRTATQTGSTSTASSSKLGEMYRDKNGFFAASVPEGWRRRDYPAETVRSKVAWDHSTQEGIILIIASPASAGYDLAKWESENLAKIIEYKKQNPTGTFTQVREKLGDYDALIFVFLIPNQILSRMVLVVNNGVCYNITYSASNKTNYDRYYPDFQQFLDAFILLDPGRTFSEAEITAAYVARYKSMAESAEGMGDKAGALAMVRLGLKLDHANSELLAMEKRLQ